MIAQRGEGIRSLVDKWSSAVRVLTVPTCLKYAVPLNLTSSTRLKRTDNAEHLCSTGPSLVTEFLPYDVDFQCLTWKLGGL